jgi:hypothetical protein
LVNELLSCTEGALVDFGAVTCAIHASPLLRQRHITTVPAITSSSSAAYMRRRPASCASSSSSRYSTPRLGCSERPRKDGPLTSRPLWGAEGPAEAATGSLLEIRGSGVATAAGFGAASIAPHIPQKR